MINLQERKKVIYWKHGKSDLIKKDCRVKIKDVYLPSTNAAKDFDVTKHDLLKNHL